MGDVAVSRRNIKEEEVRYRAAVSESTGFKIAGAINFINTYQYNTKDFFLNGEYGIATVPATALDGLYVFPFNVEIFDAAMFNLVAGSGGTTELDVKIATAPGGAFASIFSTTPKIAATAGAAAWVKTGGSGTGLTAPVISGGVLQVAAGSAIRLDLIQKQTGSPKNCGINIFFRPANP